MNGSNEPVMIASEIFIYRTLNEQRIENGCQTYDRAIKECLSKDYLGEYLVQAAK